MRRVVGVSLAVFLLFTAARLTFSDSDHVDPGESRFLKIVNRFVPSTDEFDGQKLFTRKNGKRLATPLFAVVSGIRNSHSKMKFW